VAAGFCCGATFPTIDVKWEEETGHVIVFRKPSNYANGNTQDRQGRLVTCEHGTRRVTRTEHDGSLTVILDRSTASHLIHRMTWW
jgi:gluconolactonase